MVVVEVGVGDEGLALEAGGAAVADGAEVVEEGVGRLAAADAVGDELGAGLFKGGLDGVDGGGGDAAVAVGGFEAADGGRWRFWARRARSDCSRRRRTRGGAELVGGGGHERKISGGAVALNVKPSNLMLGVSHAICETICFSQSKMAGLRYAYLPYACYSGRTVNRLRNLVHTSSGNSVWFVVNLTTLSHRSIFL